MLRSRWGSIAAESDRRCVRSALCFLVGQRRGFASVSHNEPVERLDITCGSSGSIAVDLYNAQALVEPSNPLLIYLPPTGTHLRTHHPSIPPFLFSRIGALASINYRWNIPSASQNRSLDKTLSSHPSFANHPFPTPLHDALHAYTHLITSILPRFSPQPQPGHISAPFHSDSRASRQAQRQARRSQDANWSASSPRQRLIPRPILIYGSYLGGTLATSLALTESFVSKRLPTVISGVIAKNAILNWTEITTTKDSESPLDIEHGDLSEIIRKQQPWTSSTLHYLKRSLFNNPASCFDNFVSPTLFFYSAGILPPKTWVLDVEQDSKIEDPFLVDTSIDSESDWIPDADALALENATPISPPVKPAYEVGVPGIAPSGKRISELDIQTTKSAHLKFPPRGSGLKIPRSLFLTSTDHRDEKETITPHRQAEEMARLMRRSIVLHEFKERAMYDSDVDPHEVSEERVRVKDLYGSDGQEETLVMEWIEDSLG